MLLIPDHRGLCSGSMPRESTASRELGNLGRQEITMRRAGNCLKQVRMLSPVLRLPLSDVNKGMAPTGRGSWHPRHALGRLHDVVTRDRPHDGCSQQHAGEEYGPASSRILHVTLPGVCEAGMVPENDGQNKMGFLDTANCKISPDSQSVPLIFVL